MDYAASFANRVLDVDVDSNFNPIHGIQQCASLTLEDSVAYAQERDQEFATASLASHLICATMFAENIIEEGEDNLQLDEVAVIHLYTQESPLYRILNARLRDRNRENLKPFFPLIKMLMQALLKLPPISTIVYRGVKKNIGSKYKKGKKEIWWSFGSTTVTVEVLQSELFLGKTGDRTMFNIETQNAIDITRYSAHPSEKELLLLPGTVLIVEGVLILDENLYIVQLKEQKVPGLIDVVPPPISKTPKKELPRPPVPKKPQVPPKIVTSPSNPTPPSIVSDSILDNSVISSMFCNDWITCFKGVQKSTFKQTELKVLSVVRIGVPALHEKFLAKTKTMNPSNIRWVWHGTSNILCRQADCKQPNCTLCSISQKGFDPWKARNFGDSFERFGYCSYFASLSVLPHNYNGQSEKILGNGIRAAILCRLAVGKAYVLEDMVPEKQSLVNGCDCYALNCCGSVPSGGYLFSSSPAHYMVYNSDQVLPCYLVVYKYPLGYQDHLPHNETARLKKHFCEFHKMFHGTGHGCDGFCGNYHKCCI